LPQVEPAIVDIERHQLAEPQAGGIQQLEHGAIARQVRAGALFALEQPLRRIDRERLRQRALRLRRAQADQRVGLEAVLAHQPVVPAAPGRERQRQRARREAAAVQHADEAARLSGIQRIQGLLLQ